MRYQGHPISYRVSRAISRPGLRPIRPSTVAPGITGMSKERLVVIIVVKMQYRFSYSREGIGFVLSIAGTAIPNRMRRRSHNSARLSDARLLPIVPKGHPKERRD